MGRLGIGRAALNAMHSAILRGCYSEGDFSIDAVQARMRPYYKLAGDFAEGCDGSTWEYYAEPAIVLRTVGAATSLKALETAAKP